MKFPNFIETIDKVVATGITTFAIFTYERFEDDKHDALKNMQDIKMAYHVGKKDFEFIIEYLRTMEFEIKTIFLGRISYSFAIIRITPQALTNIQCLK